MEVKAQIRHRMLDLRRALAPEQAAVLSVSILERLCRIEAFRSARQVLTYVASKDNEVDTNPLIAKLLGEGREVAVPLVVSDETMRWIRINSLEKLKPGRFGILEPQEDRTEIEPGSESSACVVPGIAFDVIGHRIGYGKGFFDRFLAVYSGLTFGLAYDFQVFASLPFDAHDHSVGTVVTERRLLWGGASSSERMYSSSPETS